MKFALKYFPATGRRKQPTVEIRALLGADLLVKVTANEIIMSMNGKVSMGTLTYRELCRTIKEVQGLLLLIEGKPEAPLDQINFILGIGT